MEHLKIETPRPLPPGVVKRLVEFANSHDDGTEQPRAVYDPDLCSVVVSSTEICLATKRPRVVREAVRTLQELRALLGY
jgi:hypothetical protein